MSNGKNIYWQVDPSGGRLNTAPTNSHLADGLAVAVVAEAGAVGASWGSVPVVVAGAARGLVALPGVVAVRGTNRGGTPSVAIISPPFIINSLTRRSSCTPYIHIICHHRTANTAPRGTPPWISRWIFARPTCKYTHIFIVLRSILHISLVPNFLLYQYYFILFFAFIIFTV